MAVITDARRSVINAILNHAPLQREDGSSVFNRKFWYDSLASKADVQQLRVSAETPNAPADLPAIAVTHVSIEPAWYVNEMQNWPVLLAVTIWTAHWALPEPEDLLEKVIDAVFTCCPAESPNVSYVKQATGYHPARLGPITMRPITYGRTNKIRAVETVCSFGLRLNVDPLNRS